jgi:hypothetical protein
MSNRDSMPTLQSVKAEGEVEKAPEVKAAPVAPSGIKVIALRPGFYANMRRVEGDQFEVSSVEKLGSWMKCVDPKAEMLRQNHLKNKKKPVAGR